MVDNRFLRSFDLKPSESFTILSRFEIGNIVLGFAEIFWVDEGLGL